MSLFPASDANHEISNSAKQGEDYHEKEENRPAGGITTAFDHIDTARRAANEKWNCVHVVIVVRLNVDFRNLAPEANAVDGHAESAEDSYDSRDGAHGGNLRRQHKGPQCQEQAKQSTDCDEDDVEALD